MQPTPTFSSGSSETLSCSCQETALLRENRLLNVSKDTAPGLVSKISPEQSSNSLSTVALVAYLKDLSLSTIDLSSQQLYERLDKSFFQQKIIVSSKRQEGPSFKVSPLSLVVAFGSEFTIKGSAVQRFLESNQKTTRVQKIIKDVNLKQLNDIDVAIGIKQLSKKAVELKLMKILAQAKQVSSIEASNTKTKTKTKIKAKEFHVSAEELHKNYLQSFLETENFIKFRLHVDADSIPLDVVVYKSLDAEFDMLKASAGIRVNTNTKTATPLQILNQETDLWLEENHLLWLHESMSGGLPRIQKWFDKWQDAKILQPNAVVKLIYNNDTPEHQAQFVTWLFLSHKDFELIYQTFESVLYTVQIEHKQWLNDQEFFDVTKKPSLIEHHVLFSNLNNWAKPNAELKFYCEKLLKLIQVSPECKQNFKKLIFEKMLKDKTVFAQIPNSIDNHFSRPSLEDVIEFLKLEKTQHSQQLQSLLRPLITEYIGIKKNILELNKQPQRQALVFLEMMCNEQEPQENTLLTWFDLPESTQKLIGFSHKSIMRKLFHFFKLQLPEKPWSAYADIPHAYLQSLDRLIAAVGDKELKTLKPVFDCLLLNDSKGLLGLTKTNPNLAHYLGAHLFKQATLLNDFGLGQGSLESGFTSLVRLEHFFELGPILNPNMTLESKERFFLEVSGRSFVFDLDAKSLYIGSVQNKKAANLIPHGKGVIYDAVLKRAIIGQFKDGFISDTKARVITESAAYSLPIKDQRINGQGHAVLNSLFARGSEIRAALNQVLPHVVFSLENNPAVSAEFMSVSGFWRGELASVVGAPLDYLSQGVLTISGNNTGEHPEIVHFTFRDGACTSLEIQNFFSYPNARLHLQVDLIQETLISGKNARLTIPKYDLGYFNPKSEIGSTERTITGHYSFTAKKFIDAVVTVDGRSFAGECVGFEPHGRGVLKEPGESVGRLVVLEHGQVVDKDLTQIRFDTESLMAGSPYFKRTQSIPMKPYSLPVGPEPCFLSYLNQSGSKIFGQWQQGKFYGELQRNSGDGLKLQGTFLFADVKTTHFIALATQQVLDTFDYHLANKGLEQANNQVLLEKFYEPMGDPMYVIPHGYCSQINQASGQTSDFLVMFGHKLTNLKAYDPSSYGKTKRVPYRSNIDPAQYFFDEGGDVFYSVRLMNRALGISAFGHESADSFGSRTTQYDHYCGEMLGFKPHGHGNIVDVEGAQRVGQFKDGSFIQGRLIFKNGVEIEGEWLKDRLHGEVKLKIPLSKTVQSVQEFIGVMNGGLFHTPMCCQATGETLSTGTLNSVLKTRGLELSIFELMLLN